VGKLVLFLVLFCLNIFGIIIPMYGQSDNNTPSWINEFPPEDEIWGVGVAKLVNSRNSMNLAELRARSAIVSQLYTRLVARAEDDEFNNLYEYFIMYNSIEASFEIINATKVLRQWEAPDGSYWSLIAMKTSDAMKFMSIFKNIYEEYYKTVFQ
jgi:hypothetical protein